MPCGSELLQKRLSGDATGDQRVPSKEVPRQLHLGKRLVLLDPDAPEDLKRLKSETWRIHAEFESMFLVEEYKRIPPTSKHKCIFGTSAPQSHEWPNEKAGRTQDLLMTCSLFLTDLPADELDEKQLLGMHRNNWKKDR